MEQLADIRKIINDCDDTIITKLIERFEAIKEVAAIKKAEGLPLFDRKREEDIIRNILEKNEEYAEEIADIYRQIMKSSRKKQAKGLLPKKIFLIGYMGSGKSTVGLVLANLTGFNINDIDKKIEAKTNLKIHKIFEKAGENYFRDLETKALKDINEEDYEIISCGGGIILRDQNIKLLKEKGKVVFLNGNIRTLLDRIKYDKNRPVLTAMFNNDDVLDKYEAFELELNKRMEAYLKAADVIIDIEDKSPEEIAEEILKADLQ